MRKTFISSLIILLIFNGCNQKLPKQIEVSTSNNLIKIDLDTCKTIDVDFDKIYLTHKNFASMGESDTIHISDEIISIKRSSFINGNDESETCFSTLEIFYKKEKVFFKDSILTVGMYNFDKNFNLLIIPLMVNQNRDNFITESMMFILDLKSHKIHKVSKMLVNCAYGFLCPDGNTLLFNHSDQILKYNFQTNKEDTLICFDKPLMSIFKIAFNNRNFEIYYFNNFENDLSNDLPMKKSNFKFEVDICK
jgi:hypothetical protein